MLQAPPRPAQQQGRIALPPIPFTAAAHEHTEPITTDAAGQIGAAQLPRGPYDVPAYGFLRHIVLEVTLSGGTLGAGVLSSDYPWNILQNIQLLDVNGAPIFGPLDGYSTLWANIIGGYSFRQDPRLAPWYDGTINGTFYLRIPVEISRHNGYGSLANQNAAAAYKLSYTIQTNSVFSTQPTTTPSVQVKSWIECWSQPTATDLTGRLQQREPIGHGTAQFWTSYTKSVAAGQQNVILPRVGNMIRNLVFICRDATGARVSTVMPDPIQFNWDARQLRNESQKLHRLRLAESFVNGVTLDTGVYAFSFDNLVLGHAGDEEPNLWLPTVQASRLELAGTSTVAGTIQTLTNDVAPVEVNPAERYVENSATGFHPALGQPVPQGA